MARQALRIGVLGAGGRMGRAIIDVVLGADDLRLAGGVERPGHPACGSPIGEGLVVCANAAPVAHQADVLVDFTSPAALPENLRAALDAGVPIVVGTTGLGRAEDAAIDAAARDIAVLQAANTALGVNLLAALAEEAARRLGAEWDIEIVELHHRLKRDAPSGTALLLGDSVARGRGVPLGAVRLAPHDGIADPRRAGGIGFASLRGGTAAGDHQIWFLGEGERLVLGHVAEDRSIFARGAVAAARFLAGKPAGRYRMADVLSI
jgi:4-hydroxy-tetrahydrodipicolinate reductase